MRVRYGLFLPPLPQDLPQLRRRIVAAISDIDRDMLQRVFWKWIIVLTSKGENTEHLRGMQKEPWRVALPSVGRILHPYCHASASIL
jgi:hypothetical protein